jgi:hypothetical protein
MLVSTTPRSQLPGVLSNRGSRLPSIFTTGVLRLRSVFSIGESRLPGVFSAGESFWTSGNRFTNFKDHTTICKGTIYKTLLLGTTYNYLGTSIMNTNTSNVYLKNLISVLVMPIWTRRSCLAKKTLRRKFSWHYSFTIRPSEISS